MPALWGHTRAHAHPHTRVCPMDEFHRNPGYVLILGFYFLPLFFLLLMKLHLHTVYSVHQNAFTSEISTQYEMDSGNSINENQLGEEESETESDTHAAGFPVALFFSFFFRSEVRR